MFVLFNLLTELYSHRKMLFNDKNRTTKTGVSRVTGREEERAGGGTGREEERAGGGTEREEERAGGMA